MKYLILVIVLGGAVCVWLLLTPKALRTGEETPSFTLETVSGQIFDLDSYTDKAICLVFFSPEDETSRALFSDFHYVSDQFRGNVKVKFLAIAVDGERDRVRLFMSQYSYPGPVLLDPDHLVVSEYRLTAFPATYVLDKQLVVSYALDGWNRDYIRELIPALRRAYGS